MVETKTGHVVVTVDYDHDTECPQDARDGAWTLYSFSTRHTSFRHPEEFTGIGMRRKLQVGLAFPLSYYEHGNSLWSLRGQGPQCAFDTVQHAGILVWEHAPKDIGAKTIRDRRADAQCYLDEFNDWAAGNCFWYRIERDDETIDSCGGFIGRDSIRGALREALKGIDLSLVTWRGEAEDIGRDL